MAEPFDLALRGFQFGERGIPFGLRLFKGMSGGQFEIEGLAPLDPLFFPQVRGAGVGQIGFLPFQRVPELGGLGKGGRWSEGGDPCAGLDFGTRRDPDLGHGAGEPGGNGNRRRFRDRGKMLAGA